MGRTTLLTPEIHKAVIRNIREGCSETTCADLVFVDPSSIAKWRRRGEKEDKRPYSDFAKDIAKAKADYVRQNIRYINEAVPENWQAACRMLEFKNKKEFSDKHSFVSLPKEILEMDYVEQTKAIMVLVSEEKISLQEGKQLIDIVATEAKVEDVTELRKVLFEIEEKQR